MDGLENVVEDETQDQSAAAPEPVDIASAFKLYNQSQQKAAADPVEDGEGSGEPEEAGDSDSDGGAAAYEGDGEEQNSVGGYPDVVEPVDLSPQKQNYLKGIQNQAIYNVRQKMAQDNIEMWSMEDIYERDEQTGRVTFNNPDDPQHPFQSRAEAQAFINAMNEEVTRYFRSEVNKEQQSLVRQQAPVLQMFDFAPVYMAMSQTEQDVFNDLIEPYAISDNSGRVIGFNTNLQAVANTARQIAKRFNATSEPQQQASSPAKAQKKGSKPALDMKTGSSQSGDDDEPKTLGEALKRYDQLQREKNQKKGN